MSYSTNPETEDQRQTYRQYSPYQRTNLPYRQLYNLPTSPEFLFEEEAAKTHLSWGEKLTFYTGAAYLAGSFLGGAKGTLEGLRSAERGESLKLRANRVLNSGGHVGRRVGNGLGSLALVFASIESGVTYLRDGDDGTLSTVIAGLGTGAFYRAASGPRAALIAGVVGGVTAFAAVSGKGFVSRFIPI